MAGPDLSAGQAAVENLMEDTCLIYPPSEPRDWVRDPDTLRMVPPFPVAPIYGTVAVPGKCKIKPGGTQAVTVIQAGVAEASTDYRIDLPLSTPPIPEGSAFVLVSSLRMPTAVGIVLTVGSPLVKTLAVQASYAAERQQRTEE